MGCVSAVPFPGPCHLLWSAWLLHFDGILPSLGGCLWRGSWEISFRVLTQQVHFRSALTLNWWSLSVYNQIGNHLPAGLWRYFPIDCWHRKSLPWSLTPQLPFLSPDKLPSLNSGALKVFEVYLMCSIVIIYFPFLESEPHWTAQVGYELVRSSCLCLNATIIPQAADIFLAIALFQ